ITSGRTAADVTRELQTLGFIVDTKEQPNAAAKGTVFTSIPNPGANADVGSTVTIIVSSGPAPVAVPQVKGLSLDQATQQAEQQCRAHHRYPGRGDDDHHDDG